mgnify:CR=1 FL=1
MLEYGLWLLPELYEAHNPLPYEDAKYMEVDLAIRLREAGYFSSVSAVPDTLALHGGQHAVTHCEPGHALAHFPHVNDAMAAVFTPPFPARATVQVSALPRGALVEVDAVLVLD